jgi:hypothetical protein
LQERYELNDLNEFLRDARQADSSLRDLADQVNIRILRRCLEESDISIAGDAESLYEALEKNNSERFYDIKLKLEEAGITTPFYSDEELSETSVDILLDDFVSYQTVRTHLQTALSMDTSRSGITSRTEGREVIQNSRDRHVAVVERMLKRLDRESVDEITIVPDDLDISVSTRIRCRGCGNSYSVQTLLNNHGCECREQ